MIGTRPLRILVVDDDPAMVGAITALVGTEGHQVITAYDGLTAVKRFREERPDLVLLDLAMPGPDGFTVIGQLRATGNVPVLVVSGESAEAAKVKALGIGADDYLVKPFGKQELLARISAVMRRVDLAGTGRVGGNGDGPAGRPDRGLADARARPPRGARRRDRAEPHADRVPAARGARPRGRRPRRAPPARARRLAGRARSRPAVAQAAPRPAAVQARGRRRAADRRRALRRLPDRGRRGRLTHDVAGALRRGPKAPRGVGATPATLPRVRRPALTESVTRTAHQSTRERRGKHGVDPVAHRVAARVGARARDRGPGERRPARRSPLGRGRRGLRGPPDRRLEGRRPGHGSASPASPRPRHGAPDAVHRDRQARPGRRPLARTLRADPRVLAVVPDAQLSLLDWPADGNPSDTAATPSRATSPRSTSPRPGRRPPATRRSSSP